MEKKNQKKRHNTKRVNEQSSFNRPFAQYKTELEALRKKLPTR